MAGGGRAMREGVPSDSRNASAMAGRRSRWAAGACSSAVRRRWRDQPSPVTVSARSAAGRQAPSQMDGRAASALANDGV